MTTRKSKRSKRKRGRGRAQKQKRARSLKSRLEKGPLRGQKVVYEPSGHVKMSDILDDFVEPYVGFTDTEEEYRELLSVAIVAWNASLLPEEDRQDMIDSIIEGMPALTEELEEDFREIVKELMERKRRHFSEYRRMIIDFELTDTGSGYHLTVASLLNELPDEKP
ncbi:MAG: hypothetical protein ACE5F6_04130 [Anaerolineae bacterium]